MEGGGALEQLPRKGMESPLCRVSLSTHLDAEFQTHLCPVLWVTLPWQGGGMDDLQLLFQP